MMFVFVHTDAQTKDARWLDSARLKLSSLPDDTDKVNLLLSIDNKFLLANNVDSEILYSERTLKLAKKLDWENGLLNAYGVSGLAYYNKGDRTKALENYLAELEIAERLHNKDIVGNASMNIGLVYEDKSDYYMALNYYFKTLKIFESEKDSSLKVPVLNNIGNVYLSLKNYDNALLYYNRVLQLISGLNVPDLKANMLNNVGDAYNKKGEKDTALSYYERAFEVNKKYKDSLNICIDIVNIGNIYQQKKNYSTALYYYFNAYTMSEKFGYRDLYPVTAMNIGEVYFCIATDSIHTYIAPDSIFHRGKQANLHTSIAYLKKAQPLLTNLQDYPNLSECTQFLADAYEATGDYAAALYWRKQSAAYKDSVFNTENLTKISNLETQRQIDIREKQIEIDKLALAKKRNERIFFIVGICLLVVVIGFVIRSNQSLGAEKQRSENLLLNILPAEVATELKEKGSAAARHFDNVTVLFTDFVNFTEAGERMHPQQLIDELHTCFKVFDEIIMKYNIEKIKTIGDAYLAVCGLPLSQPDNAQLVVKAAIEIRDFMIKRYAELGDKTFKIRIGIHSGNVVAGIVGVKKFAYDIWGDTVNIAARMEQNSEAGKINISQTTYELVKDKFHCTYRGEIEAKNKGMMKMYYVD